MDDFSRILLVFSLSREGERVLGLSIGNLVDPEIKDQYMYGSENDNCSPEPFVGRPDQARKMPLYVLDVIEPGRKGILDVDDDDLPVRLAFIEECHDAQNFDLLDLADVSDLLADLANIEWIVVALGFGLGVRLGGVFPGLCVVISYQQTSQ